MKLRITHETTYEYDEKVSFSPHALYLRPRESAAVRLHGPHSLEISPTATLMHTHDEHDNNLSWAYFQDPGEQVVVNARCTVETLITNPFAFILASHALKFPFTYKREEKFALTSYLAPPFQETQDAVQAWLKARMPKINEDPVTFLTDLNTLLHQHISYRRREEHGIQSSLTTLQEGTGACRDSAVLLVELLRTLGIAARFVSGYLYAPPDDNERSVGAMHAWTEVFLPGAGWRGLDPTHGIWCNDAFVPVAHAAEAERVNPIQGSYYSPHRVASKMQSDVVVDRLDTPSTQSQTLNS